MTTLMNREEIARRWFPETNTIHVEVVREASLTADLSAIKSRRVHSIQLRFDGANATIRLDIDTAEFLRGALYDAITAAQTGPLGYLLEDDEETR